jgi:hypothetical protein
MSLDKFVMRGYTGSVGNSSGQWVARSPDSQQPQTFQPNNDGGTSFVMGGGGLARPYYRNGGRGRNVPNYRDEDYMFNSADVSSGGTAMRRDAPSGCFGARGGSSGGMDGQKAIIFIFIIIMAIVCAFVALSGATGSRAKAKRPAGYNRGGQQEQTIQRGSPVWY